MITLSRAARLNATLYAGLALSALAALALAILGQFHAAAVAAGLGVAYAPLWFVVNLLFAPALMRWVNEEPAPELVSVAAD